MGILGRLRARRKAEVETEAIKGNEAWPGSPFNADVIGPGEPGWAIFEAAMKTGGPVVGRYDTKTGEIVEITPVSEKNEES